MSSVIDYIFIKSVQNLNHLSWHIEQNFQGEKRGNKLDNLVTQKFRKI